ncbi:hypothetical protein [Cellulomonas sp. URHD0024]|uniref:hypothetical protein n=1 Tax=Cellulomonas sp. URHD0024 TaxID=1302620 RepID=UPI000424E605|nr:hypothetical protein [Cellulomonas sp. URHD0024]
MSALAAILRETDRGLRPQRVAERLRLPVDVVSAALEHAEAVGLLVRFSAACSGCPTDTVIEGCAGCPLAAAGPAGRPAGGSAPARR